MLTEIDVHYLVGLLIFSSGPNDVEVEFGNLVLDTAAEELRDVDVTVTRKNADGTLSVFKGFEVKDHSRRLDSSHVEQLCLKLNDMPDIKERAIVSASGYTKPAIKKAKRHNVSLLHLLPWNVPRGFDLAKFHEHFGFKERRFLWNGALDIQLNPDNPLPLDLLAQNPRICDSKGNDLPVKDLDTWVKKQAQSAVGKFGFQSESDSFHHKETKNVKFDFTVVGEVCVNLPGSLIPVQRVIINGPVQCVEEPMKTDFRMLLKEGDTDPYVGCAITELPNGNLFGFALSSGKHDLHLINIPINDRLRKKIYRQKL